MEPNATEDHAEQKSPTRNRPSKKQLSTPSVLPRLHVRPWWFPEQELSDPLVLYIESWLADVIFGEPLGVWVSSLYSIGAASPYLIPQPSIPSSPSEPAPSPAKSFYLLIRLFYLFRPKPILTPRIRVDKPGFGDNGHS